MIFSRFKISTKWPEISLIDSLLKSKRWVLDKIVCGTLCGSVVAKINTTCGGGSSNVFKSVVNKNHAYFVHSYEFIPEDKKNVSLTTNYGKDVMAAVSLDNIYGSQFHPEKSQNTGIQILANFLNL